MRNLAVSIASIAVVWFGLANVPSQAALPLDTIKLPAGFKVELYAENVPGARSMVLGEQGILFVGTRQPGKVYAIPDRNKDGKGDELITIMKGGTQPNGIAYRNGALYVSDTGRVVRFDHIESQLSHPPQPVVLIDNLPTETFHGARYTRFGPDGKLYVPVGAPCNVCERDDKRFATILRMDPDGKNLEVFAQGVRNTVGFDWHPVTKELWFTENGRDMMGDDLPADELNVAPRAGLHFGFPYCHQGNVPDPELNKGKGCAGFTPPAHRLDAHAASLGMRFYTGQMFPAAYRNQIFVAQHGSWNGSVPQGYRLKVVRLEGNKAVKSEVFADGWLQGGAAAKQTREDHRVGNVWGRPADILVMPDGALLVSDDTANAIYRISYGRSS